MIIRPREISKYDLPTTKTIPDGYDMTEAPEASDENMAYLIEQHNLLVKAFNDLFDAVSRPHGKPFE